MWEVIGTVLGMLVLFFLFALLPYIFDLPESLGKLLGGRLGKSQVEKRLCDLEAQVNELRAAERLSCAAPNEPLAWSARLDAASAITDPDQRDEAFAKLAADASLASEVVVVQTAVGKMADTDMRDETACRCAVKLALSGRSTEAIELAKTVADTSQRDEALARMAEG